MEKLVIGSKPWLELLISGAQSMGIALYPDQARQMATHCELLAQWNRKINLTAIVDPFDMAVKHVLDSIAPVALIPDGAAVLDMGAGGGFPGIPLKILNPSLSITLVDSVAKKINFVKHAIRTLALKDCIAMAGRVEVLGEQKAFHGQFQAVISRSFAALDKIVQWGLPFLAPKGRIIALKGKNVDQELTSSDLKNTMAESRINFDDITVKQFTLPYLEVARALVKIECH